MSRYDGLIIPRSYSEYINKTDAATLLQALQLSGVMDNAPTAGSSKPVKSNGLLPIDIIESGNMKAVTSNAVKQIFNYGVGTLNANATNVQNGYCRYWRMNDIVIGSGAVQFSVDTTLAYSEEIFNNLPVLNGDYPIYFINTTNAAVLNSYAVFKAGKVYCRSPKQGWNRFIFLGIA